MTVRLLQSLSVTGRGLSSWNLQARQTLQRNVSRWHCCVPQYVVAHFTQCPILHSYKCYVTVFATAGNKKGIGHSMDGGTGLAGPATARPIFAAYN